MEFGDIKKYGIIAVLLILAVLVGSSLFSITGSQTEVLNNEKSIELHLYPEEFAGYVKTRPVYGGCYTTQAMPYEGYSGYYEQSLTWYGAERKLIGSFCVEQPIMQVYSASANVHFEDFYGTLSRPPLYLGMTDNAQLSNQDSEIAHTSVYYQTTTPTVDVGLNAVTMTEYVKGDNCFDVYALGGGVKCNVLSGMDVTINHLNINYDPIECADTDTAEVNAQVCDDGDYLTEDICYSYQCQNVPYDITQPDTPAPSGLSALISDLIDWIKQAFNSFFFMSILGETEVTPGETVNYVIDMTTTPPDHVYQDGTYQTQYGYWALVDSSGNILTGQTEGVELIGTYKTIAIVEIPQEYDSYILMATITQIDSTFDFNSQSWVHGEETVIVKEALDLTATAPAIIKPAPSGLSLFLSQLMDWFKDLFAWLI